MASFSSILADVTKQGTKLQTSEYLGNGKYPIIDQGQDAVAGYTDREDGLFTDVPVIVFGDHTRIVKYVVTPFFLGADGVKVLKGIREDTDSRYLYYVVSSIRIPNTGYNRHFKWLKEADILIPDLPTQRRIAATLDKVSEGIALCKQMMTDLEELVKSRFVEMFGTVHNNVFQFAEGTLESISYEFFAGGDKPSVCTTERDEAHPYPVFANGYENEGLQGYSAKCRVTQPAVTVSARGTIGYCFIRESGFTPVVRLITIVPNNKVSPVFLKYAIDTMDIKSSGTSQAQLTVPDFKRERIIVPPADLQGQFAAFVSRADKSKFVVQQHLAELETLKKSLMQEYFG